MIVFFMLIWYGLLFRISLIFLFRLCWMWCVVVGEGLVDVFVDGFVSGFWVILMSDKVSDDDGILILKVGRFVVIFGVSFEGCGFGSRIVKGFG